MVLAANGNSSEGVDFEGSVTLPPGSITGKWNWVQLITPFRLLIDHSGNIIPNSKNGLTLLDTTYPYWPRPAGTYPGTEVGSYMAGSTGITGDSPNVDLLPLLSSVTIGHQFSMYLMFKPDGLQSRYVPMSSINWSWNAVATNNGTITQPSWIVPQVDPTVGAAIEQFTHPTWTGNVKY